MVAYAVVYLVAAVVALVSTPLVARLARAMRIMDRPAARKVHVTAVPRIGGIAVILAMLAATLPVLLLKDVDWPLLRQIHSHLGPMQKEVVVLLAASAFICLVGLIDDIRGMPAKVKLLAQVAAAVAVCALGIRVGPVGIRGWFVTHPGLWSWPITILWIVGITNAVNLIDGLDGLAAGISAIACGVIAVFAFHRGQTVMGVLMLAMLGSLTGFLFFNFNPARIFLGDCGSMFLGFFLATASVMSATKSYTLVGLALPALALGLPIFDALFTMVRRFLERRSIFSPDRDHIHHRLIDMGLHHRHAVILMYVATLLAAGIGMFMMITREGIGSIFIFAGALVPVLLIFRLIGPIPLREAWSTWQRNRAMARQAREDRQGFDQLRVRLSRAANFQQWWKAIRRAARELGFARLALELENRDGSTRKLVWRLPHRESTDEMVFMTIPVCHRRAGEPLRADMDIPVNGALESAGRRAALFARLLDEHSLATVPCVPRATRYEDGQPDAADAAHPGTWVREPAPRDQPKHSRQDAS